ncbi:uncharacterized protein [Miscanthus floridulus]|uniref:uncharacterized protein n=1 Tax=Miscanthus floridulus TaxID=154761 RepID=UPI00345A002F
MHVTKVLMVGGSGLNILYASTLNKMGIPYSNLHPSNVPFYGIMPGKEAMPLGHIWLNAAFGQPDNFRKEPLTFEVIDFPSVYHARLHRLCFAKFMAIPNYTYLKLKMPGSNGVITIEGSFEKAHYYEQHCVAQAAALITFCDPDGSGSDIGRASTEEAAKVAAVLDRPRIDEANKVPSSNGGSASPSIEALGPRKGVDPIKVSSNLFQ